MYQLAKVTILTLVLCISTGLSGSEIKIPETSKEMLEKAKKLIDESKNNKNMKAKELAKKVNEIGNSDKFKQEKNKYIDKISNQLNLTSIKEEKERKKEQIKESRLILFFSSSMPIKTIREYIKQMESIGGLMVMQGTLGDGSKMQPTLNFFHDILKKDPNCQKPACDNYATHTTIDPRLFRLNGIKKVPALVFNRDFLFDSYMNEPHSKLPKKSSHVVYGDASLPYMIKALYKDTKYPELKALLDSMKKNEFSNEQ